MSEDPILPEKEGGNKALGEALGTAFSLLRVAMILLIIAFLGSGVESIEQYEDALILRFGALEKTHEGGESRLALALPFPVDRVIKIETGRTRTLELGDFLPAKSEAEKASGLKTKAAEALDPARDGYLLTSDFDILHCRPLLKYRVKDATSFHFNNMDLEQHLRSALRSAVVQTTAGMSLEKTRDTAAFTNAIYANLQRKLDHLNCGIHLLSLEVKIEVPRQLEEINSDLSKAYQDAAAIKSAAELFAQRQQDETQRQTQQLRSNSEIELSTLNSRLRALQQLEQQYAKLYSQEPELTKQLILQEAMKEILSKAGTVIYLNPQQQKVVLDIPRRALKVKGGKK